MFANRHRQVGTFLAPAMLVAGFWTASAFLQAETTSTGTSLHVNDMGVSFKNVGGPRRVAIAYVDVLDEFGTPVDGATVTGEWSGCIEGTDSAVTQSYLLSDGTVIAGRAVIEADKANSCWGKNGCSWTFTVTDISKPGMTYDSAANRETSDSTPCR